MTATRRLTATLVALGCAVPLAHNSPAEEPPAPAQAVAGGLSANVLPSDVKPLMRISAPESSRLQLSSIVMASDGRNVVTGPTVAIWDIEGQKFDHATQVTAQRIALSPDGETIALIDKEGATLLGPLSDAAKWVRLPNDTSPYWVATATRDGRLLGAGESTGLIQLKTLHPAPEKPPGNRLHWSGHVGPIVAVAFSGDHSIFVTWGEDETVRVWDSASGKQRQIYKLGFNRGAPLAVSDSGSLVAAARDKQIVVWKIESPDELAQWEAPDLVARLAFAPDDKTLAAVDVSDRLLTWEIARGNQQGQLEIVEDARIADLAYSPDGKYLALAMSADTTVRDPKIRERRVKLNRVRLLDPQTLQELGKLDCQRPVNAIRFSADSSWIAMDCSRRLWIWDFKQQKPRRTYSVHREIVTFAFTSAPTGIAILDAEGDLHDAKLIDQQLTRRPLVAVPIPATYVGDLDFSPDGKTLVRSTPASVRLWDAASGLNTDNLASAENWRRTAAYSPRDDLLAVAGDGVGIWNPVTRQLAVEIPAIHVAGVHGLKFSPDGLVLAVHNDQGQLRFMQTTSGRRFAAAGGLSRFSADLSFSSDGRIVAAMTTAESRSKAGLEVGFWDVLSGQELFRLADLPEGTNCCRLSPDGKILVTGDARGGLTLWDFLRLLDAKFQATPELTAMSVADLWKELQSDDAVRAWRAVRALAEKPNDTLPEVRAKLPGSIAPSAAEIRSWIEDLKSPKLSARRRASLRLHQAGPWAYPHLRQALDRDLPAESRHRLELLLASAAENTADHAHLRSIQLLEFIGSTEATNLLREYRNGASAWVQLHAEAAHRRVGGDP